MNRDEHHEKIIFNTSSNALNVYFLDSWYNVILVHQQNQTKS
jgi:hypothetical protein